jgi:hypothetical protein
VAAVGNAPDLIAQELLGARSQRFPLSSTFDVVIPSTSSTGRSRYWGSSSAFALTVEVLQHAVTKQLLPLEDVSSHLDGGSDETLEEADDSPTFRHYSADVDEPDIAVLVRLYLTTLNIMYGFVDQVETNTDLQFYLGQRKQPGFDPQTLHNEQAHRFFRISMMCAISCANQARHQPHRSAECLAYYADAIACVEEVTSEATPASLQALLLLIVFCLFLPRKGDIWKLLDYACRLTIELGYHTEDAEGDPSAYYTTAGSSGTTNSAIPDATTTTVSGTLQSRAKLRRSTFWGLYAIERIVGQLFGRGSDLPETIITTEYPSSLAAPSGISPLAAGSTRGLNRTNLMSELGMDQETLQSMSIAHHYRLVYLRSEIFRSMYLPASTPDIGLKWLTEKYKTLFAWRQELEVSEDLAGVATLTCDVGFDATMCFLFQPLLMKALKAAQGPTEIVPGLAESPSVWVGHTMTSADHALAADIPGPPQGHRSTGSAIELNDDINLILVASDPFYSAINLIRTYQKIIRAPKNSQLGQYPMTFMSAHYIYLATSTLLAYALLKIDGRTKTLRKLCEIDQDIIADGHPEAEELEWDAFMDVSTSCLILLAWCVERWPGMLGMLEVYQRLFYRVTRELIKAGVVQ